MPFVVSMLSKISVVPFYFAALVDADFPSLLIFAAPDIKFVELLDFLSVVLARLGDLEPDWIVEYISIATNMAPHDAIAR
jgi:hypothetical protein